MPAYKACYLSIVGGPRLDGALVASSGRTATTKAMGKGSTQVQHQMQTEVPPKLLESWLELWAKEYHIPTTLHVELRPHIAGSELLELSIVDDAKTQIANVIFQAIQDRRERHILSIRDQNTLNLEFRRKRLMTLVQLFLIHRYKSVVIHYVTPTDDNQRQTERMKDLNVFDEVHTVGDMIVASVNSEHVRKLLKPDGVALKKLIGKSG